MATVIRLTKFIICLFVILLLLLQQNIIPLLVYLINRFSF